MSWMEFTLSLIEKLIWPSVLCVSIFALRNPLSTIIPLARKLKYKDLEIEFHQELKAASKDAENTKKLLNWLKAIEEREANSIKEPMKRF